MKNYQIQAPLGADGLHIVESEVPEAGPGQILVKVHAASLNYRDIVLSQIEGAAKPGVVPLSDGAGEVVAIGSGVREFAAGDRVAGNFFQSWADGPIRAEVFNAAMGGSADGMLREFAVLNADCAVKIPDWMSYEAAATLPCAAVTVWNALFEAGNLKPGETVVLLGTGGVSIFGLQFAKTAGARVIITSSSDEKLERARAMGADETINYKNDPEWARAVKKLTGGVGADHVVEVGGAGTLPLSLNAARVGGNVHLIGILSGNNQINPMPVMHRVLNLRGIYVGSTRMFREMLKAMDGARLEPVIDRVFDFGAAVEAYKYQISGAHFGKIVVRVAS